MRTYFVPALFILLLTACKDKPQGGTASTEDTTVVAGPAFTIQSDTTQKTPRVDESYRGREPIIPSVQQILTHIPDGYYIIDTCSGDLNLDNYTDYLIVLAQNGEDSLSKVSEDDVKRRLLILTGTADQSYTLAAQSDNAVYCLQCGGMMGDPFQSLVIKNGYFSIEHYGGSRERWTRTITFKYSKSDSTWNLHKDGHGSFTAGEEDEKEKMKIYTVKDFGKVKFAEFDIYKN